MNEPIWTILAMSTVTYATRLWGLLLPASRLRGYPRRVLDLVPVAVFAALAAQGLPGTGGGTVDDAWRVAAAAVTVAWAARTRSLGVALLLGSGLYLAVRAVGLA